MGLSENGGTPKSYSQYYLIIIAPIKLTIFGAKNKSDTPTWRFPKMGNLPANHPVMSQFS